MLDLSFQFKGSVITVVVLELRQYDSATLNAELQAKIDGAPQFFINSPVLINLEKLVNPEAVVDLKPLLATCRSAGLLPVGFAAVPVALQPLIEATGLALLPAPGKGASKLPAEPDQPQPEKSAQPAPMQELPIAKASKIVTRPVRSGQQVYAEGADLIVLAQVSEGAEVLADGHIHVYGALRGRALAGVQGDGTARIFCQSMEAELVSVAGNFLLKDAFAEKHLKKPAQIYLADETLCVEPL